MNRCLLVAPLLACVLSPAVTVRAQDQAQACDAGCEDTAATGEKPNMFKRAWYSVCRDFKRNNNWPDPFVTTDRVNTRIHFDVATANGWRVQNTLDDHHFVDNSTELTEAGRLKVAAIINQTPLCYRAIFVLRDANPERTAGRVVSIQESVASMIGDRPPVPIFETYDKPRGTSAFYVDEVTRRYNASIPDPRIPDATDGSSLSGGSGGGSGGSGP